VRIIRIVSLLSEDIPIIDDVDRAIMHLLMKNGRMRDVEIAKAVSVSDDTVRRRRRRLENAGLIRIEAVFNARKFGYTNSYQLGFVLTPGTDTRAVAGRLAELKAVHFVALSFGPTHSILANCRSRDPMALNRLVEELRTWKEIERVDVNIIYDIVKTMFHRLPEDMFE
jgi:DNA-binding Lrp family transcriptional regulator